MLSGLVMLNWRDWSAAFQKFHLYTWTLGFKKSPGATLHASVWRLHLRELAGYLRIYWTVNLALGVLCLYFLLNCRYLCKNTIN